MSDYIKREDAQDIIDIVLSDYLTDSERTILEGVNAEIGEIPSADVVEVKHGQWLLNGKTYCECSICHHQGNEYGDDKYCRHCGTRMDGDKE